MGKYLDVCVCNFRAINVFGVTDEDDIDLPRIDSFLNINNENIVITSSERCDGAKRGSKFRITYETKSYVYSPVTKDYREKLDKEVVLDGLYELTEVKNHIKNNEEPSTVTYRFAKVS